MHFEMGAILTEPKAADRSDPPEPGLAAAPPGPRRGRSCPWTPPPGALDAPHRNRPAHRDDVRRPARDRTEQRQLVQRGRPARDVAPDERRVALAAGRAGCPCRSSDDAGAQPRGVPLQPVEDPLGEPLPPVVRRRRAAGPGSGTPPTGSPPPAGTRVGSATVLLADDELRGVRQQPAPDLGLVEGQLVEVAGDVDDRGRADGVVGPRRRAVEVDVDAGRSRCRSGAGDSWRSHGPGRCCSPTRSRASTCGLTPDSTARRAPTPSPSAVRTPTARPPRTTTPVTRTPVRTTTPGALGRLHQRAREGAARRRPGTGMPCCCAAMASSRAGGVEPAPSTATSAWVAWPASSIRAGVAGEQVRGGRLERREQGAGQLHRPARAAGGARPARAGRAAGSSRVREHRRPGALPPAPELPPGGAVRPEPADGVLGRGVQDGGRRVRVPELGERGGGPGPRDGGVEPELGQDRAAVQDAVERRAPVVDVAARATCCCRRRPRRWPPPPAPRRSSRPGPAASRRPARCGRRRPPPRRPSRGQRCPRPGRCGPPRGPVPPRASEQVRPTALRVFGRTGPRTGPHRHAGGPGPPRRARAAGRAGLRARDCGCC